MVKPIQVKILTYRSTQQYAVQKTILSALNLVRKDCPDAAVEIIEVRDIQEHLKYTQVFILPSLVIEEKVVCVGRFPKREEVAEWLLNVIQSASD